METRDQRARPGLGIEFASSSERPEARALLGFLALAVGSLVLSGLLALALVIGRAPFFARFLPDPLFFKRCLVVHVDLSLVVWFLSFAAALTFLLPGVGSSRRSRHSPAVATGGVAIMLLAAGARDAVPILSNYVPMIDHALFKIGMVVFGAGILLGVVDGRLLPRVGARLGAFAIPACALPGLRAVGIALLLAALTFASAWFVHPQALPADRLFELTNWGGGHVLQLVTTAAMLSVWLILLGPILGRPPLKRVTSSGVFMLLVAPWLVAPVLPLLGVQDVLARESFTVLMRWGLFPATLLLLAHLGRTIFEEVRSGRLTWQHARDPRFLGFSASALLTLLGYVLGALIRGSNTMIPAHYHAAIGGVTAAFMAVTYPLLAALGLIEQPLPRRIVWQPAIYGFGQGIFAIGFAIAGAHGMARKTYGSEQHAVSVAQQVGLGVMALGGLLAVTGGLLYLAYVVGVWLGHARTPTARSSVAIPIQGGTHG